MRLELTTSAVTGRRSNQLSHWALMHCYCIVLKTLGKVNTKLSVFLQSRLHPENHQEYLTLSIHCLSFEIPGMPLWPTPRPISTGQLHALPHFHPRPINLVVFKGSYFFRMGYLILGGASRLDAFSVYPVPTWLRCHGPGDPTAAPEVSPPRSSRTKGGSLQISCAHAG